MNLLIKIKISKVELLNNLRQKIKEWKNIKNKTENKLQLNKLSATIYIVEI